MSCLLLPWGNGATANTLISQHMQELRERAANNDHVAAYELAVLLAEEATADALNEAGVLLKNINPEDPRALNLLGLIGDPLWFQPGDLDASAYAYARAALMGYAPADFNLRELVRRGLLSEADVSELKALLQKEQLKTKEATKSIQRTTRPLVLRPDFQTDQLTSTEIFKKHATSIVEVKSEGNYGSGVLIGRTFGLKSTAQSPRIQISTTEGMQEVALVGRAMRTSPSFSEAEPLSENAKADGLLIATNAHVLQHGTRYQVGLGIKGEGESRGFARPFLLCRSTIPQEDLAFIFLSSESLPQEVLDSLTFASLYAKAQSPEKGTEVFAIGNPEGLTRTITQGLYNGLRPEGIQFDAPISVGSSGGALLNDAGHLLGLTTGFSANKETQNLNFALPAARIIQNLSLGTYSCSGN